MIKYKMDETYEEVVEVVESKIWNTVMNDAMLKSQYFQMFKRIFTEGNNLQTESELIDLLSETENKSLEQLKNDVGNYMIRHIIDKNYMNDTLQVFEEEIIKEIVDEIKENIIELDKEEVLEMEVISQSQFDNLIDEGEYDFGENCIVKTKTWHSRMTVADGMSYDDEITVEIWVNGNLEDTVKYQAE